MESVKVLAQHDVLAFLQTDTAVTHYALPGPVHCQAQLMLNTITTTSLTQRIINRSKHQHVRFLDNITAAKGAGTVQGF